MIWTIRFAFGSLLLLLASCNTVGSQADVARLEQRLQDNPYDTQALRDLGVIYARTQRFEQASPYLARAYDQDSSDVETAFYRGLALEMEDQRSEALRIYSRYRQVPRLSPYRKRMAGRYKVLVREVVREEVQASLSREAEFQTPPPNTVAVFPLAYQGDDERYEALGRGLSEMIAIDLSQVQALTVLERVRLNVLLEELELGQSQVVDPSLAPRVGRILAARHLFGGAYNVLDGTVLQVDAASLEINETPSQDVTSKSDALANLFVLEKDLVFNLLGDLGIELAPAERQQIEQVPTRNLQAFLAYSRGLLAEDAGRFDAARAQFERAQSLDGSFIEATEQVEDLGAIDASSGSPQEVASGGSLISVGDLVLQRQQNFGDHTGTLQIPDPENPKPPVVPTDQALPKPRRPPGRQ